jgi:hypothetical protein
MPGPILDPRRWLTVSYRPDPEQKSFLGRAVTAVSEDVEVTAAALSDRESHRFFGVRMARKGVQPVWLQLVNNSDTPVRPELFSVDPAYYTPLEAAYVNHFSVGKRLLSFGILAWLFLPLVLLVPFKSISAHRANRRMNKYLKRHGLPIGLIPPGGEKSGFVFTTLDESMKKVDMKVLAGHRTLDFAFSLDIPGLDVRVDPDDVRAAKNLHDVDEKALCAWLETQPRTTTNRAGNKDGDPLNLVIVGDSETVRLAFGGRWDPAEVITVATCSKMAKAFIFDSEYRYSPVSSLYLGGVPQDLALQRARAVINERIHLRLWRTPMALAGQQVWIGQISRDIGVRFTFKTWNLTTHKIDPDVDEARDYVTDNLLAAKRVARFGYVAGAGVAPPAAPRENLTGDPYFTDGLRAVIVLSRKSTEVSFFDWKPGQTVEQVVPVSDSEMSG